ncbi:sodium- and chloride-dependent glycine transporter 1-like [Amphiura filiformis]|uniref:sodium- and chloride-dependent glycine transporter 1-like n=1 Tax=Amphiura filiformis TaxID=82378 RepID=UPI003B213AA6
MSDGVSKTYGTNDVEKLPEVKMVVKKEKVEARETWGNKIDFILSSMGYVIGLGNVWRFPYLAYDNGGGAFLLPYLIMLFVTALPIMFLELCLGQFASLGCISVWRIAPLFRGLGYGMALVSVFFCLYYNIVIAYAVYYMFASCQNPLPWVGCNHTWNTDDCWEPPSKTKDPGGITLEPSPSPTPTLDPNVTRIYSSEEYWKYVVLDVTDGLHDLGIIKWDLCLCFLLVWIVVYFCIIKGVKSSGKVVYFTATFPYAVLITLLILGVLQPGSVDGILYFLTPQFEMLKEAKVWKAAANQVFFSFGAGWGGTLTLASYHEFHNNSFRDVFIIVISGALTSIFAGIVIFSIIGFMSYDMGVPIDETIDAGMGLAFVAYPEAISRIPVVPQLWAFLFFFMLITLGLDSEFVTLETVITAVVDEVVEKYPVVRRRKPITILVVCIVLFLCGLPLTTQGGIYVMTLFDWYSAGFSPMMLGFLEVLVISYVYGLNRFMNEIKIMVGSQPRVAVIIWSAMWYFITPALILFIFIYGFIDYSPAYFGDYIFPPWAEAIGWILGFVSVVVVFVYMIYPLTMNEGTFKERLKLSLKPTKEWGPALNINRKEAGYEPLPNQDDDDEPEEFGKRTPPPEYSNIAFETDVHENVQNNKEPVMRSIGVDTSIL